MPPPSGSVEGAGFDILNQSLEARRHIGYLPETVPLYTDMTVSDYLSFMGKIRGMNSNRMSSRRSDVIEICSLNEYQSTIIGKLSKGYRQRVGIAQAILHEPDVLVLDEPTIGIDPIQVVETRQLIKSLGQNHTLILSSHILPEITQICKRVIIINEGEIAAVDSLGGLTASLRKSERLSLTLRNSEGNILEKLKKLDQVISAANGEDNQYFIECKLRSNLQDDIAKLALENHWGIVEIKPVSMTLEDIFLKLTLEEKGPAA